jgi:hypothetical protein
MVVYVVTTGSYSDYSVRAIFADRELAELHRSQLSDANEVEEFDLIETAPTQFLVHNMSNDTYRGTEPHEWSYPAWSYNRKIYKRAEATVYRGRLGRRAVRVSGWDKGAVTKAFQDRMAEPDGSQDG